VSKNLENPDGELAVGDSQEVNSQARELHAWITRGGWALKQILSSFLMLVEVVDRKLAEITPPALLF